MFDLTTYKPTCWTLWTAMLAHIRTALLYGPPGTGKTTAALALAKAHGAAIYSLTLTELTSAAELRGHYVPKGGDFLWHDGPLTRAWRESHNGPVVLNVNEINNGGGDIQQLLYAVLDSNESARLTLPTGETITPGPGFRVVATMNPDPGDLPDALRDRFEATIHIDQPHPDAIARLPKQLQPLAIDCVTAADDDRRISMRQMLAFARLAADSGNLEAAAAVTMGVAKGTALVDSLRVGRAGD